jgi:AcrR family transcriptional regulator
MNDRKYKAQKNAILEKARELFWQKGYDGTSLKDIASACGFEASNIYYYYKNKEDILFEALRIELDRLVGDTKQLKENTAKNPVDRLKIFIDTEVKTHLGKHRLQGMLIDSELRNLSPQHRRKVIELRNKHDDILSQIITDGIKQGYFRDIDVKLAVYTISSAIIRSRVWFSPTGRVSLPAYSDFIFQFMLSALRSDKIPLPETTPEPTRSD